MSSARRVSFLVTMVVTALAFTACQRPAEPPPAQPVESAADREAAVAETNKAAAMRFMNEVVSAGKIDVLDEILDPSFVEHAAVPPEMPKGIEGLKAYMTAYRQAFPDATVTVEQIAASGDIVAIRSLWKGTQKGEWMGVKPTNQVIEFEVLDFVKVKDGKATDHWGMDDSERKMKAAGAGGK